MADPKEKTAKLAAQLLHIGALLETQDVRATSEPIYLVRQSERMYGADPAYETDGYIWGSGYDTNVEEGDPRFKLLEEADDAGSDEVELDGETYAMSDWEKRYYRNVIQVITPCFTEEAANDFITRHRHNLKPDVHVYVDSGWNNAEWCIIRKALRDPIIHTALKGFTAKEVATELNPKEAPEGCTAVLDDDHEIACFTCDLEPECSVAFWVKHGSPEGNPLCEGNMREDGCEVVFKKK